MATTEPRTKAMLAIRRNMRKKAAGQYSKMSAEERQRLNSGLNNKVNVARKVPKLSGAKPSITTSRVKDSTGRETIKIGPDKRVTGKQSSTVLNKKPNDPRTLSMIHTESQRKRDAKKAALRKSYKSTGRTGPKKEYVSSTPILRKNLTQSEINEIISLWQKMPPKAKERTALEIKNSSTPEEWKRHESIINQKNAQTSENQMSRSLREETAREDARLEANAAERKREGVREKRTTRIQKSDARRTKGSSRPIEHPEGESGKYGRSRSVQETADVDFKITGGEGRLIKPADNPVRGKLNKKIADAKKAAMRYYNDSVRAKALKEGEVSIAKERAIWRKKVKEEIATKAASQETEREAIRASGNARDNRSASVRRTTQKLKDAAKAVAAAKASAAQASGSGSMQVNRPKASLEIEQAAIVAKFQAKKLAEEEARTKRIKARIARTSNTGVGQNVRGTGVGIGGGTLKQMR